MKINVPKKVEFIIEQLIKHGHEAYAVGGCVRDSILHRVPGDWDITTSASPMEVKEIFHRTVDTGIQHGTVTVLLEKEGFEVTTYRLDGEYEDCRHPKQVEFTKSLIEDLKRRDFTINAMAYNCHEGLVDAFDGLKDLERNIIRCVGSPSQRFEEDALRILRAIRFSAQLGFSIEEATKEAMIIKAKNLSHISAERIRVELNKLLISDHPNRLLLAYETGITGVVLPEFDGMMRRKIKGTHETMTEGEFALLAISLLDKIAGDAFSQKERIILSYALLLQRSEAQGDALLQAAAAKKILKRLKFDNETIQTVVRLITYSEYQFLEGSNDSYGYNIRKGIYTIGLETMDLWFAMRKANLLVSHKLNSDTNLEEFERSYQMYVSIRKEKQCVNLKMLAVNGSDLIKIGFLPGKELGETLEQLLFHVLIYPKENETDILLSLAKKYR